MTPPATILAVDDTTESLALLRKILTAAGYQVRLADSGELALAAVAAAPPDLILLDIKMPGMEGLEVCRRLKVRAETRGIPVILLSAVASVKEWVEGLQLGAADHIGKPFQTEELLARIGTQLALRRAQATATENSDLRRLNEQLEAEVIRRQQAEADLRQNLATSEQLSRAVISTLEDQQRAEVALRESDANLQALLNAATQSAFLVDPQGTVLEINEIAARRLNRKREEILHTCILSHLPPEIVEARRARLAQVFATSQPMRFEDMRADLWLDQSLVPILDQSGKVARVAVFAENITERKRTEREHEATVELLRLVNESRNVRELIQAAVAFFRRESGCEAVGLRLQEGEDYPYFEAHGFPPEFVRLETRLCARDAAGQILRDRGGNPLIECMCGNVICGRFDPAKPFFTARGSFWTNGTTALLASTTEADHQARTRNRCHGEGYESVALLPLRFGEQRLGLVQLNDRRPGRFSPEIIALWERLSDYLAVALAKLRAEEALAESEENYRSLVETAQELVWKCDAQGRFSYLNPAWEKTHGYKIEELLGRNFGEFQRPEVFAKDFQEFSRHQAGGSVQGYETTHLAKDGRELTLLFNATFVRDPKGEIIGTQGTAVDITARKQAEDAIRRALAEKEILLKEVHHRVKNNLQVVSGLLELQAERLSDPQLRLALKESQGRIRSIALVHEKLYQSEGLARVDFKAYVQSLVAHLFHAQLGKGRVVRSDLRMTDVTLSLSSAVPCGLLINELVTNALKHAFREDVPAGTAGAESASGRPAGAVTAGSAAGVENKLVLAWEDAGAQWRLTVADNGVGLPAGLDWAHAPTLGLRLVRLLTQQLKGSVRLEPGVGCRFVIEFPKP